jgi:uncharacterized protein YjeT (DUF2065 family)
MTREDTSHTAESADAPRDSPAPTQPALLASPYYRKSLLTIALEVVLISGGVFLGLMGEQWRERAEQRELAREALRRFRTEIRVNRGNVAANVDYHAKLEQQIREFLKSEGRGSVTMTQGLGPVFFEQAAWDLALATQALAHIDTELAFEISRVYTIQQGYAGHQSAVVPTVIFGRSPTQDADAFWRPIQWYLGDVTYFDQAVLKAYDAILPQIDRALGGSSE